MDKLTDCASKLICLKSNKATPGFCNQDIEERLQPHHAAMDFSTGCGGKIITDPKEVENLTKQASSSKLISLSSLSRSSLSDSEDQEEVNCSTDWFRPGLGREQANLVLYHHRHEEGVFLIRTCSRMNGGFVLSFTTGDKIVHAQIARTVQGGKTAFSVDGGRTKFPSLDHLVDFYMMNMGPLPCLLSQSCIDTCDAGQS